MKNIDELINELDFDKTLVEIRRDFHNILNYLAKNILLWIKYVNV